MAFPPVFDNVWDITQPPDTQLANLLGQDLRSLKDDVMQRMSLLSGTLANRPTPEAVNATWGGAGFGLTYIATDTKQLFQWNGGAWVDISAVLAARVVLNEQGPAAVINGNGAAQVFYSFLIPANTIGLLRSFRVTSSWFIVGSAATIFVLSLNGTTFFTFNNAAVGPYQMEAVMMNTGVGLGMSADWYVASNFIANTGGTFAGANWAIDQTLQITFNVSNANSLTPRLWIVELV